MEVVISLSAVALILAKVLGFFGLSGVWAFICLFPVSEQPTSKAQWSFYIVTEVLLFALIFGFLTVKFS
jgi:hypothetical protein